jgi:hypothetical protein
MLIFLKIRFILTPCYGFSKISGKTIQRLSVYLFYTLLEKENDLDLKLLEWESKKKVIPNFIIGAIGLVSILGVVLD